MNNPATRHMNEIYQARLKMFGKENADEWLKRCKAHYQKLARVADRKGFRKLNDLLLWRRENREEYDKL